MNIVNLTPHVLNIFAKKGDAAPAMILMPSGIVARCSMNPTHVETTEDGIPIFCAGYGDVEGMPADWQWPKENTILVTSALTKPALDSWLDERRPPNEEGEPLALVWVASPGELVRNAEGQPIGCIGLNI